MAGELAVRVAGPGGDGTLELTAVGADGVRLPALRPAGTSAPAAQSVTLTADAIVVRNALATRRVPRAQVTAVHVTLLGLRIAARADTGNPAFGRNPASGRHAGGRVVRAGAVRIGGA